MSRRSPPHFVPLAIALLSLAALAQEAKEPGSRATYGIDRFLQFRSAGLGDLSPDGKEIAFRTNVTGVNQVWKVSSDGGWPEQLTFFEDRVGRIDWSPDGRWIVFSKDEGGNERNQVYLLSPDGAEVRDLSARPDSIHEIGGWSRDGKRLAFTSNRRKPAFFDVYVHDLASGETTCVHEEDAYFGIVGFSPEGGRLLLSRWNASLDNDLFVLDLATRAVDHLTPHTGVSTYQGAWTADGKGLWVVTNEGREYAALLRLDLATKRWAPVHEPSWDVEWFETSEDGRWLALSTNVDGRSEVVLRDLKEGGDTRLPIEAGIAGGAVFSRDGARLALTFASSRDNGDVWIYEVPTKRLRQVTRSSRAGVPRDALAEPQFIHFESFDQRRIPALFYRPKGLRPGERVPCLVLFHGGPEGQSRPSFNPVVQYFVHRGFAVLEPNVRGSTGYGRAFTHLDDVRRREDSVRDGAAAVEWLRRSGVVDPEKVAAMGGSYGGYMVLASLTLFPEIWSAGVDFVGIANFVTFLQKTGPERVRLRESEYGSLENDLDFLVSISPIHHIDKVRAPLLVVHGANDRRVPVGEAEQIVEALRGRGATVEYLRYEDEGHGLSKLKNRIDAYPKVVAFLDRVFGRGEGAEPPAEPTPASGRR